MKIKDKITFYLAQNELSINKKFKNLHKGQSCYIFGNGVSLKSMEMEKYSDKISIGCNSLFVHKDFNKLDCRYYHLPASLLFYPYRTYVGKFQRNYIGALYRKKVKEYTNTHFFTSLSNSLNMRGDNISYLHHFGHKEWNYDLCEMDGVFSFMAGSIYAMLGSAVYMGFEHAVLVGCDYTFTPRYELHFFDKGMGNVRFVEDLYCGLFFEETQKRIDLTTLTLGGVESALKYKSYNEYFGCELNYKENTEIIERASLELIHKQGYYNVN